MHKQHLPGRKHPAVKPDGDIVKNHGDQNLNHRGPDKIVRIQQPVIHQRQLQIREGVYEQQCEHLRKKHVHKLKIAHLEAAVGAGKKI